MSQTSATQTKATQTGQTADASPSVGDLVSSATADLSTLIRKEVELAKVELSGAAKSAGIGAGAFGGAGFVGLLAVIFLSIAAAEALDLVMPTWLAFLIVAVVYLLVAGVLALVGKKALGTLQGPERTIATAKDTVAWAKHPTSAPGVGARPGPPQIGRD